MANFESLSDIQAILLACELCASGKVAALPYLRQQFPTSLNAVRLYRILLSFLPESYPPHQYTAVLDEIDRGVALTPYSDDVDLTKIKNLDEPSAWKRVRRLKLLPLRYFHADRTDNASVTDPLTDFLIHRAHRIDVETGLQTSILELLLPFYHRSDLLHQWLVSKILPLLRANYEYYPDREDTISLSVLESMDSATGINVLLSMTGTAASETTDLTQNLRGLVGPWIYGAVQSKRRRLDCETTAEESGIEIRESKNDDSWSTGWNDVNDWLLSRSLVDFKSVASAFDDWDGPEDIDLGGYMEVDYSSHSERLRRLYGKAGLAIVYATEPNRSSFEQLSQIVKRIATLLQIDTVSSDDSDQSLPDSSNIDLSTIATTSKASLLQNGLLRADNVLTTPSPESITFLQTIIRSAMILQRYGYVTSCRSAASVYLHGNEETQSLEFKPVLDMIVKQANPAQDWRQIRTEMLWLRDWNSSSAASKEDAYHGLFWRVPKTVFETELLKAMITTGAYRAATEIYTESSSPLDLRQVESAVVETIISFYDNASNGNKSRGKMKRAVDILNAFQSRFSQSEQFKELTALINATHALSFYSLTLQHGVPFQPVGIRIHDDPLSLIEKVLDQNPKSYTKLDDLLSIGRNFVLAGLGDLKKTMTAEEQEQAIAVAERRVISMAVSSALASDDFGTAYSYILTRLMPSSLLPSATTDSTTTTTTSPVQEDISWRAAYNAGRYRSPTATSPSSTDLDLSLQIHNLSQRMELLSLALILAPTADPLPEVLGAWRRCDEEMTILRTREFQEAEEWDRRGDQGMATSTSTVSLDSATVPAPATIPGGFAPTDQELDAYENAQQRKNRTASRIYDYDGGPAGFSNLNKNKKNNNRSHTARRYDDEDAPMGLFDVARGAARALSKNLTPLQQQLQRQQQQQQDRTQRLGLSQEAAGGEEEQGEDMSRSTESLERERVRKRDVVSNMVTGGLASGIGWVLGAQPVNNR